MQTSVKKGMEGLGAHSQVAICLSRKLEWNFRGRSGRSRQRLVFVWKSGSDVLFEKLSNIFTFRRKTALNRLHGNFYLPWHVKRIENPSNKICFSNVEISASLGRSFVYYYIRNSLFENAQAREWRFEFIFITAAGRKGAQTFWIFILPLLLSCWKATFVWMLDRYASAIFTSDGPEQTETRVYQSGLCHDHKEMFFAVLDFPWLKWTLIYTFPL